MITFLQLKVTIFPFTNLLIYYREVSWDYANILNLIKFLPISFSILYRLLSESSTSVMLSKRWFVIYIISFTFTHWHFIRRKSFSSSPMIHLCIYILWVLILAPMFFWYVPIIHWTLPHFLEKYVPGSFFFFLIWVHRSFFFLFQIHFILSCLSPGSYNFLKKTLVCFSGGKYLETRIHMLSGPIATGVQLLDPLSEQS